MVLAGPGGFLGTFYTKIAKTAKEPELIQEDDPRPDGGIVLGSSSVCLL
jgi:hypothetical protein